MSEVQDLIDRARKFRPVDLVRESEISRRSICSILSGQHANLTVKTMGKLEGAVLKLEEEAYRKFGKRPGSKKQSKNSRKTDSIKIQNRNTRGRQ